MGKRKSVWIGGLGVGLELCFIAAAALGAPRLTWLGLLLIGLTLIVVAIVIGQPLASSSPRGGEIHASGGGGTGHGRGNVLGDNATLNIGLQPQPVSPLAERSMLRISIADLRNLYREHTQVQAEKLVEPYIGGWKRLEGEVYNVKRNQARDGYQLSFKAEGTDELVFATFLESVQEQLPRLRRGDPIEVVGRLVAVEGGWVELEDCEFAN